MMKKYLLVYVTESGTSNRTMTAKKGITENILSELSSRMKTELNTQNFAITNIIKLSNK